ncbi:hypothetical protein [Mycetocola zhujimingii]|uniref:hypothetical protein n=1 Tax=Mycetocola zhujimingii TaxID=2079792 RepID=UPI000D3596B2|nr:hypothetical protein [Mycetocola zhujimingii]AWB86515.1 hypothetical protein C3E77_07725 [Mycetocola zhujimingii]
MTSRTALIRGWATPRSTADAAARGVGPSHDLGATDVEREHGAIVTGQDGVLCGYRLVRVISHTAEGTTWLAVPAETAARTFEPDGPPTPDAIELTRLVGQPPSGIAAAAAGLSPYVHAAIDVATDDTGSVILIAERTQRTLAELLTERRTLVLGEAVTILAPVAAGLAALTGAGIPHGALTTDAVAFTPDGRPVITRLGVRVAPAPDKATAGTLWQQDRLAFGEILRGVLDRCGYPVGDAVPSLLRWFDRTVADSPDAVFFSQLELRLFALADPLPVAFSRGTTAADVPEAPVGARPGFPRSAHPEARAGGGSLSWLLTGSGLDLVADLADGFSPAKLIRERTAGVGGWLRRTLSGRAALIVVATVVAITTVWGGLSMLPGSTAAPKPTPTAPAHAPVALSDAERTAIGAEDPDAALRALLGVRARCLASGNVDCVALVDEDASAAEATDVHAIESNDTAPLSALPATGVAGLQTELIQRTGNAVLFRVGGAPDTTNQPVLVLVMKTNTGWLLRDLAEPDGFS